MNNQTVEQAAGYLAATPIFKKCGTDYLQSVLNKFAFEKTFRRGAEVGSREAIGVVISGRISVRKGWALINELHSGEIFGAAALFAGFEDAPTALFAKTEVHAVFLTKQVIASLIKENSGIFEGYLEYLSNRIFFLTKKIEDYTAGSADDKLAGYLLSLSEESANASIRIENRSLLAQKLNMGRTSLYRSLNSLKERGAVRIENGEIFIINREILIDILKY